MVLLLLSNATLHAQCTVTAPTAITGPSSLCFGTGGTMLNAVGGSEGGGCQYQWGTGSVIGSNIITGAVSSLYVNPSVTTTYWVRRQGWWPCTAPTGGVTFTITVGSVSTPPTSISNASTLCHNTTSTTLTAIGGTAGSGSYYQWGTGYSVGDNIIGGANGPSITVNPSVGTAYWVRRVDPAPCNRTTGGPTITLSVPSTAPTSITGPATLCYTEGGAFLYAHGGIEGTNSQYEWGTGTVIGSNVITTSTINSLYINPMAPTDYWVRRIDPAPCGGITAGVTFHVDAFTFSSSPTAISGITTICKGTSTTLTATGGAEGSNAYYEWGTGWSVGDNIIPGENNVSIVVSPAVTTIYWVRRIDRAPCARTSYGPTVTVTVPLPVTWSGSAWSSPPTPTTPIIVAGNLDLTSNLRVCSCDVINTAMFKIHPSATLTVTRNVSVVPAATLMVESSGSLVQVDDVGTFTGSMTIKRDSAPMKAYDYTYWSAPVWSWRLSQLSPLTLNDKYYSWDPAINNWSLIMNGNAAMQRGKGYIVRAPQGWSLTNATSGVYTGMFTGNANTGTIPVVLQKATSGLNLIGNPYPSAIDMEQFLRDPVNSGLVNGTVYLWTHNTAISSLIPGNWMYNYTADDYAKFNLTGGVRSAATAITGGALPDGKIASGQAFFIETNTALANGNYTVYFRNNMRVEGNNGAFYRTAAHNPTTGSVATGLAQTSDKNRLWLSLSNANGAFSQVLLGYVAGATNGFDNLYDGKTFAGSNPVMFYTVSGTDTYSIEGRGLPFNPNDVVPMGYKSTIAGSFSIAIDDTDGFFPGQVVYLIDKLTNVQHSLKTSAYHFTTAAGTFNNRFELRFSNASDAKPEGETAAGSKPETMVFSADGALQVLASTEIVSVIVYDLNGRKIAALNDLHTSDYRTVNPSAIGTIVLVKTTLKDGSVNASKVILK
ncbi:hypothetical protein [Flavobacterium sp.]|uniref:hypothetical protein n=1 Tax=Flavobacterium sp. TaxID=239 RepID=UPI0039E54AAD